MINLHTLHKIVLLSLSVFVIHNALVAMEYPDGPDNMPYEIQFNNDKKQIVFKESDNQKKESDKTIWKLNFLQFLTNQKNNEPVHNNDKKDA